MNTIFFTKEGRDAYEGLLYSKYLKILFIIILFIMILFIMISFCIYVLALIYIDIIYICRYSAENTLINNKTKIIIKK